MLADRSRSRNARGPHGRGSVFTARHRVAGASRLLVPDFSRIEDSTRQPTALGARSVGCGTWGAAIVNQVQERHRA
jgi:hypothetical protein